MPGPRIAALLLTFLVSLGAAPDVLRNRLVMADGVALAVTYYLPERPAGTRVPVLLELLPYRKDDMFLARDYSLCEYFARHGLAVARVDLRGTGSSAGRVPDREYSEQELDDAVEIIGQLSRLDFSNGAVGMYGISWSGFNAIQVAMRAPAALKAILAACASDDLFHDDVHYIDGILHLDEYALDIDHHNGLPRSPDYPVDAAYLRDRFSAEPWLFAYLAHPRDGAFWRGNSLRYRPGALKVPAFLIGGLADGYRDSIPRMLAAATAPMKAIIGPWNHSWPDEVDYGPALEWRPDAVRWWNHWLRGEDTGLLREPPVKLFVRAGHAPATALKEVPGFWRDTRLPVPGAGTWRLHPQPGHLLSETPGPRGVDTLRNDAGAGTELGYWWGELTPDQRGFDRASLVYDSAPLAATVEIAGQPRVVLDAVASAPQAHWVARLEDVQPDGSVALVTGAALNGTGAVRDFPLHFTTWRFQPGHRIRLALSNGAFPMFWPAPAALSSTLRTGAPGTFLELPVVPAEPPPAAPALPVEPRRSLPGAVEDDSGAWSQLISDVRRDAGRVTVAGTGSSSRSFGPRGSRSRERLSWWVDPADPARAGFRGTYETTLKDGGRTVWVRTTMTVTSDATDFHALVKRQLREGGGPVRAKVWRRTIPRDGQ